MKIDRRTVLFPLGLLLLIAQLIPFPPAENPPVGMEVDAPTEAREILKASCYDCHSNESVWPWYSHVIPAKWFVRQHVVEGRSHLNFSTWGEYSPERANRKLEEVAEEVEDGAMPLPSYLRMHPEAVLSQEQRDLLVAWAEGLRNGS